MDMEGMKVSGAYMDVFRVIGTVDISLPRMGRGWSHLVTLDSPKEIMGRVFSQLVLEDAEIIDCA